MFSKVFFVLAAVCVVKASVIPDNVFDDNPETEVARDPKACSPQACRDACRRLGFPIGVCSGGRCFCRRAKAQEDVSEQELSPLENLVSQTDNEPETEVVSDPKSCNTQACRNACRRLGFTTGVCSGGRCFCRRSNIQDAYPLINAAGDEKEEANEILSNGEEVLEQEPLHLEELVSRTDNDPETEVASDPKSTMLLYTLEKQEDMIDIFAQGL
ncbi:hypothetical protein PYW07_015789 [Mythimna separata]|uniref:Knottins-like domain-containing protein n=1 Tax=Mythimna separata TaxID=271217 RepID=A0AAD7YS26_MYTSE|nr:hypothetical protein PYW07_015789 [Mythimna separata]